MSRLLYSLLLRLVPSHRRERDGEEMWETFDALRRDQRTSHRWFAVARLWIQETGGFVKLFFRDRGVTVNARLAQLAGDVLSPGGIPAVRWAWRGVRARGARGWVMALLLAVALAANAVVFAVSDALVFRRAPYPRAHDLVEIQRLQGTTSTGDRFMSAPLLDQWRLQTDLFASVQGYLTKSVFVVSGGRSDIVATADITPGLIELLGVSPAFGRTITQDDTRDTTRIPSLISMDLARTLFGEASQAVGRTVETTAYPLIVVGVMPADFGFPSGAFEIWRSMDPRGPLTQNFSGVQSIARLARGASATTVEAVTKTRSIALGQAAGARAGYAAAIAPYYVLSSDPASRKTFLVLLGAAMCLLITACANVASLELAGSLRRGRTLAVHVALGASRGRLALVSCLEGLFIVGGASALGALMAVGVLAVLRASLPRRLVMQTANAIDLDARTMTFMAGTAVLAWLIASLPAVMAATRVRVSTLLKSEDRGGAGSRASVHLRRALTVVEIAAAVVLLAAGVTFTRSYLSMTRVDKGFDSRGLVGLGFSIPVEYYAGPGEYAALAASVMEKVRSVPGVESVLRSTPPPGRGATPTRGIKFEIDGVFVDQPVTAGEVTIDADYFSVLGVMLPEGRSLRSDEPVTSAVISEPFARQFWPDGHATGHSFRPVMTGGREQPRYEIVGVVREFRTARPDRAGRGTPEFYYYTARQPPPPVAAPARTPARSTGGSWRFLDLTVRLDSLDRGAAALAAARSVDPRLRVTLESVDDAYAAMFADVLLTTRVTSSFGVVAFLVAAVGIYGVMSFLVAARRREIGIRVALGATRRDISRLVMGSSLRLVLSGAALGVVLAMMASRSVQSLLYGTSATDPLTYAAVTAAVIAVALTATWQPARDAARVDAATTLKAD